MKKKKLLVVSILSLLGASCVNSNPTSSLEMSSPDSSLQNSEHSDVSSEKESAEETSSIEESSSQTDPTKVTGVKFVIKTVNVDLNGDSQLQWKIYPKEALNTSVRFEIEDSTIASVSATGLVHGLKEGETIVTIITEDGAFQDTATIHVVGTQATGIHLIVPEATLQDENGIYLLKIGQSVQLSYQMEPVSSVNSVTFSTMTSSSSSASAYLSVSKGGVLKALKLKARITVSITTDNLFTDSVTFSVVKDSIYSQEFLKQKLSVSTSLEKEKIVRGTKKIVHKKLKSQVNEKTEETFEIHTNGVKRSYTETDYSLNKTKTYDGYYGIYNNKFYQLNRSGLDYSSSSVTGIGTNSNEISLDEAKTRSSLIYYRSQYGLADIIRNEYVESSVYFGYMGDWSQYSFQEKNNTITIAASYEKESTSYLVSSYFRKMTLSLTRTEEGMLTSYTFESNDYDSNGYDFTNHALKEGATPYESVQHEMNQEAGDRNECSSFPLYPSQCYFTSYQVDVTSVNAIMDNSVYVGDYLSFDISNSLPNTATKTIDSVSFQSSDNENVVKYSSQGGLRAIGEGEANLTFVSSNGVTSSTHVTVSYQEVSSIAFASIKNSVKVGDTLEGIQAEILPVSANPSHSMEIVSGGEYATLSYNETNKSYSLTGISAGDVVLEAKSLASPTLTVQKTFHIYNEITEEDVPSVLLSHKYKATAQSSKDYIYEFKEDGKGKVVDRLDEYASTYATFTYTVSGFAITLSDVKIVDKNLLYSIGNLTLDASGLYLTGKLQTSSSSYTNKTYTFEAI